MSDANQPLALATALTQRTEQLRIGLEQGIADIYKLVQQMSHPNVQRKLKAAATWCERINALDPSQRGERNWHYALVGESLFHDWREKGARLGELLAFSRVRPTVAPGAQAGLALD